MLFNHEQQIKLPLPANDISKSTNTTTHPRSSLTLHSVKMGVQMYTIAGRQIGSHYLAIGVITAAGAGIYAATRGPSKAKVDTPPINAGSPDEEKFIKDFLTKADEGKKH